MSFRTAFFAVVLAPFFAGPALAQSSFAQAVPPEKSALDRLNLKNEWTIQLPFDGRKDGVGVLQIVDDSQLFLQTRSGLLVAIDATTGARQWSYRYPAAYVITYRVAVNDRYVFAVNSMRLFCFHRYTGLMEFEYELPARPTAAPVVDSQIVYLVLGGTTVSAYRFPTLLAPQDEARGAGRPGPNVADTIATRYTTGGIQPRKVPEFDPVVPRPPLEFGEPITSSQSHPRPTPSLAALPTITPPYSLYNRKLMLSPSIGLVPSLRQPYELYPEYIRSNQRTPSITSSAVWRLQEQSSLRPKPAQPIVIWSYTSNYRIAFDPVLTDAVSALTPGRLWLVSDDRHSFALSTFDRAVQVVATYQDTISSPLAGPALAGGDGLFGFIGLSDGVVVAADLSRGTLDGPRVEWKANLGGLMNRKPIPTADAVYAAGEHSGVAKIDLLNGEILWRTHTDVDRVLAINQEYVYALDRFGTLMIFDRNRATDPARRRADPLARLSVAGFTAPVSNDQSDRILLASDSGTMICLRDASAKYLRPYHVAPPTKFPVKKAAAPAAAPAEAPKNP